MICISELSVHSLEVISYDWPIGDCNKISTPALLALSNAISVFKPRVASIITLSILAPFGSRIDDSLYRAIGACSLTLPAENHKQKSQLNVRLTLAGANQSISNL